MAKNTTFAVIGSGGGGGTIAWLLAKAGYDVTIVEQGADPADIALDGRPPLPGDPAGFNSNGHDEYKNRVRRPHPTRRLRGDYNTFRLNEGLTAVPFKNGWTASVYGGGSVLWGTWAYRALPVDLKLATFFQKQPGNANNLNTINTEWGYDVVDWPIGYADLAPYYNVAEALLAVSGDAKAWRSGIESSTWFKELSGPQGIELFKTGIPTQQWAPTLDFPCGPYPITPVGRAVWIGMEKAGLSPLPLPTAIVQPGSGLYATREKLKAALAATAPTEFWQKNIDQLWSERVRQACNMCGFCGEFLCWGGSAIDGQKLVPGAPKSGTHSTVLKEFADMAKAGKPARTILNAKVLEILYDGKKKRATGVRFLDVRDPEKPASKELSADYVIVSCGAVQTARLLLMSGPPEGLGNSSDLVGRNATFHLFGMGAKATFKAQYHGLLHGEFGHTGNVTSFAPYFVRHESRKMWLKGGTMTSTAKKNPLENVTDKIEGLTATDNTDTFVTSKLDEYARSIEIRLTADDLPMRRNRVDLDPVHVDEFGVPVARITREVGTHEVLMYEAVRPMLENALKPFKDKNVLDKSSVTPHVPNLVGDHQMGTCRMGKDKDTENSVLNPFCRMHDVPNVFVVDSSFMPTGLGLNPMVTVVANALRVGSKIVDDLAKGRPAGEP